MTLRDLAPTPFVERHVGPDATEQAAMLATLGLGSLAELAAATVPAAIRTEEPLDVPSAEDETAVGEELRALAARNTALVSLLRTGYPHTTTPPATQLPGLHKHPGYSAHT